MANPDQPKPAFDLIAAARERRKEIARLRTNLAVEDESLANFLKTADALAARLAPPAASEARPIPRERLHRLATKADVIEMARLMFKETGGQPIQTGQVASRLIAAGYLFGGNSPPSSVVSAYLGQAEEISKNPSGAGWVPKHPGWINDMLDKMMS